MFTAIATSEYPSTHASIKPVLKNACTMAIAVAFISGNLTAALPVKTVGPEEVALFSMNSANNSDYYNGNISFCWDGVSVMSAERSDSLLRILEIEKLQDNWNENGASSFSKGLLDTAKKLVMSLAVQPAIFPTARDSIQFEYEKHSGDYLEIELFENGRFKLFSYSADGATQTKDISFDEVNEVVNRFYGRNI